MRLEQQLEYTYYLDNKNVVIVGGASECVDLEMIENADLVVRVNDHWRKQRGRCDILYASGVLPLMIVMGAEPLEPDWVMFNFNLTLEDLPEQEQFCRWADHNAVSYDRFYQCQFRDLNPRGPGYEWANILYKRINTMPFTGIMAAYHLSLFPVRAIGLTGFSFYQTPSGVIPHNRGPHNLRAQVLLLQTMFGTDARLYCDRTLADILEGKCQFQRTETYIHDGLIYVKPNKEDMQ